MKKENMTDTYTDILFCLKKKGILQYVTTWMNMKDIRLSEIRQLQKNKYFTYMNSLKWSNLEKQRVEWQLPGAKGSGDKEFNEYKVSVCNMNQL